MRMRYSDNCRDLKTYWDRSTNRCVPCRIKPGYRVTPNCGFSDDGSRHEVPFEPCANGTFNDGSSAECRPCSPCPPGHNTASCNKTTGLCDHRGNQTTALPVTETTTSLETTTYLETTTSLETTTYKETTTFKETTTSQHVLTANLPATTTDTNNVTAQPGNVAWAAPLAIFITFTFVCLSYYIIKVIRKKGQSRPAYMNPSFLSLTISDDNRDLPDILSSKILSAPLQKVLDNLDVLEELVILLDPETNGIKNTKHLASLCYFPSTWINYTYSMKESKSPLKALLEGVTCRHPDWTVWNLAKLLRHIERNDAVSVLAKLRLSEEDLS